MKNIKKVLFLKSIPIGYLLKEDENKSPSANIPFENGEQNDPRFVIENENDMPIGYWTSSPAAHGSGATFACTSVDFQIGQWSSSAFGLRPLIRLDSSVKLKEEANGTFSIVEN